MNSKKYFEMTFIQKIKITSEEQQLAKEFARKMNSANKNKGDSNVVGKIGEIAAKKFLERKGYIAIKLDLKVHHFSSDSGADMEFHKGSKIYYVHVKTQRMKDAMKYCLSWTFQVFDYAGAKKDQLIDHPRKTDIVITVVYDDKPDKDGNTYAYICGKFFGKDIKNLLVEKKEHPGKGFLEQDKLNAHNIVTRTKYVYLAIRRR